MDGDETLFGGVQNLYLELSKWGESDGIIKHIKIEV